MPHSSRQPMPVRVAASQNRVFTLTQASAPPPLPPTLLSLSALQMAQQIRVLEFLSMIKFKHDTSLAALQQQAFLCEVHSCAEACPFTRFWAWPYNCTHTRRQIHTSCVIVRREGRCEYAQAHAHKYTPLPHITRSTIKKISPPHILFPSTLTS